MSVFDNWTYDDAMTAAKDLKDTGVESNRAFRKGDHWQKGDAWIGPRPQTTDSNASTVMLEIERGLVSQNVIAEVDCRRRDAVVGREPSTGITVKKALKEGEKPNEAEQREIDEGEAAYTNWWDKREVLKFIRDAVTDLGDGRGLIRFFVPPGRLVNGQIPPTSFEEAFDLIYLNVPEPSQATIVTDPNTQSRCSVFLYDHKEGEQTFRRAEISYVADEGIEKGKTIVRILTEDGDTVTPDRVALSLGGRLTLYEMKDAPLITAQVRQHQALLNMARTMMARNVVLAGFLERIYLNSQQAGEWVPKEGGGLKFEPDPHYVGAATAQFVSGLVVTDREGNPILDAQGRPTIADPTVVFRDPVPVQTFEDTARAAYTAILEETHQLHAAISGDATASGESRKQAMEDFRKSLQSVKAQVDACGRWLIETALAMAAEFSGDAGRFNDFRAVFDCQIDAGKPTSEEINTGLSLVEKNIWKRARLQGETGVEDPDAEDAAILADREKLEPMETIRVQRARVGLKADEAAGQSEAAIRARLERGAQEPEAVN